jgi:hypothetical protein
LIPQRNRFPQFRNSFKLEFVSIPESQGIDSAAQSLPGIPEFNKEAILFDSGIQYRSNTFRFRNSINNQFLPIPELLPTLAHTYSLNHILTIT